MAKHGFPIGPIPEPDRQDALDRFSHKVPEQLGRRLRAGEVDVSIESLIATQKGVDLDHVNDLLSGAEKREAGNAIDVLRVGGKNFIWDGHHASEAARLRGDKSIRARLLDLDTIRGVPTDLLQKVMSIHNDMSEGQRSSKSFSEFMQDAREYAQLTLNRPVTDGEIAVAVSALESEGFISRISFSSPSSSDLAAKQSLITANPPSGVGQPITGISSDSNEIAMPLGNVQLPSMDSGENTQLGKMTMLAGAGTRQAETQIDPSIDWSISPSGYSGMFEPSQTQTSLGMPQGIYSPPDMNMSLGGDSLSGGSISSGMFSPEPIQASSGLSSAPTTNPVSQGGGVLANVGGAISSAAGSASNFVSSGIDSAKNSLGSLPSIWSAGTNAFGSAIEEMMGLSGNRSSSSGNAFDDNDFVDAINSLTEAVKNLTAKIDSMPGGRNSGSHPTYDEWAAKKNGNAPTVEISSAEESSRTLQADILANINRTIMMRN
jgi:hypothetical protein